MRKESAIAEGPISHPVSPGHDTSVTSAPLAKNATGSPSGFRIQCEIPAGQHLAERIQKFSCNDPAQNLFESSWLELGSNHRCLERRRRESN